MTEDEPPPATNAGAASSFASQPKNHNRNEGRARPPAAMTEPRRRQLSSSGERQRGFRRHRIRLRFLSSSSSRAARDVLAGNDDAFLAKQATTRQQDGDGDDADFCRGMYMTMFMDGFRWTLFLKHPSPQCLNYFVKSWRLEDPAKFRGAVLYTFLLAILVEGLSSARGAVVRGGGAVGDTHLCAFALVRSRSE